MLFLTFKQILSCSFNFYTTELRCFGLNIFLAAPGQCSGFHCYFSCRQIPSLGIHHIFFDRMKKRPDWLVKLRNGENLVSSNYFTNFKNTSKYLSTCSRTTAVTGTPGKLNSKHLLKSLLDKTSCTINSGKRGEKRSRWRNNIAKLFTT